MENTLETSFGIRIRLLSIFEEFYFTFNVLKQLEVKDKTKKSEDLEIAAKHKLNECLRELWVLSDESNYYWHNCSFEVFKKTFETNSKQYQSKFGKKRFYSLLEKQLSFFSDVSTNCTNDLFVPLNKPIMEDLFTLFDYGIYLDDENFNKICIENSLKFEFVEQEIMKDNYYIIKSHGNFKIKKSINRVSKSDKIEYAENIEDDAFFIQNVNVFNIGDKAYAGKGVDAILKSILNLTEQHNQLDRVPDRKLNKKGLPKFNIQTRYGLFLKLGGKSLIDNLICPSETSKGFVLGSIMDINPDNARHLISGTYKKDMSSNDHNSISEFLKKQEVKIKKISSY